jgi:hypothetical protein
VDVKGVKVLAASLEGADVKTLRDTLDQLKDKLKSSAIVLAAAEGEKVSSSRASPPTSSTRKAGELVTSSPTQVGGKGGGARHGAGRRTDSKALPRRSRPLQEWVSSGSRTLEFPTPEGGAAASGRRPWKTSAYSRLRSRSSSPSFSGCGRCVSLGREGGRDEARDIQRMERSSAPVFPELHRTSTEERLRVCGGPHGAQGSGDRVALADPPGFTSPPRPTSSPMRAP